MEFPRRPSLVTPKTVTLYTKLFKGIPVARVASPNQTQDQFYAELLTLDVDREFVSAQLYDASTDLCLGPLKAFLNSWFKACIHWARLSGYNDVKKIHALETLAIIIRNIFAKSLAGWEIMEALAGSVNESDAVFTEFTNMVANILSDHNAPGASCVTLLNVDLPQTKHLSLQLALTYACGAGQTSLGSYFLRRDFFSTIVSFVKGPDTEKFTFEAILLLCVLANFHRSDAARLNPYLRKLATCDDTKFLQKVNWATDFALRTAIKSYHNLSDDTLPQNLTTNVTSLLTSWRPARALSAAPIDPPRELFKDQPIEAAVALLPIFELVTVNMTFSSPSAGISSSDDQPKRGQSSPSAVLLTAISLSSYILAHSSSTSSPRALAYAALSLKMLLSFTENLDLLTTLSDPTQDNIQICRQRMPTLPVHSGSRAPICSILDCCTLWLRHNLQYKLEIASYTHCLNIVQRVLWYLRVSRVRLEYDWKELWSATLGLLNFIGLKGQSITTPMEIGGLVEEGVGLLEYALSQAEKINPSQEALYKFVYELIRFSDGMKKLRVCVLDSAFAISNSRTSWISPRTTEERLNNILETVIFYENKISTANTRAAKDALRVVARAIDSEGLHGVKPTLDSEPPKRLQDAVGFVRYGYMDILALMP